MYSQHELKEKSACPAEAEGLVQNLLQDLKAGEFLELIEAWKTSISCQGEFPKLLLVSILTVCKIGTMVYSTRAE